MATTFCQDIGSMNDMYRLPNCSTIKVIQPNSMQGIRLMKFYRTLVDEISEGFDIVAMQNRSDEMVAIADWFGDIVVYCYSEAAKYGVMNSDMLSSLTEIEALYASEEHSSEFFLEKEEILQSIHTMRYAILPLTNKLPSLTGIMETGGVEDPRDCDVLRTGFILERLTSVLDRVVNECIERARNCGIPLGPVLRIIMDSNSSKLGADGEPIYNDDGKFLKGPNYWRPGANIAELLRRIMEAGANPAA